MTRDVILCIHVYRCTEATGQHWVSFLIVLLLNLELTTLESWMASKPPRSPCVLLLRADVTDVHALPNLPFHVNAENPDMGPNITWQLLFQWSHTSDLLPLLSKVHFLNHC